MVAKSALELAEAVVVASLSADSLAGEVFYCLLDTSWGVGKNTCHGQSPHNCGKSILVLVAADSAGFGLLVVVGLFLVAPNEQKDSLAEL